MALLRTILYSSFMLVTLVPWALAVILAAPFSRGVTRYRIARQWLRLMVWAGTTILGIRNDIRGLSPLQVSPGAHVMFLSKHQSTWETFVLPAIIPLDLALVFKRELTWLPFFGWAIALTDMIHIDRTKGKDAFAKVVTRGRHLMAQGRGVLMFPEGTRMPRGETGMYKLGGARLACETEAVIIPVALATAKVWPRKAFLKKSGVAVFSFGPPISTTHKTPRQVIDEVQNWIEEEMRRIDPQAYVCHDPIATV